VEGILKIEISSTNPFYKFHNSYKTIELKYELAIEKRNDIKLQKNKNRVNRYLTVLPMDRQ